MGVDTVDLMWLTFQWIAEWARDTMHFLLLVSKMNHLTFKGAALEQLSWLSMLHMYCAIKSLLRWPEFKSTPRHLLHAPLVLPHSMKALALEAGAFLCGFPPTVQRHECMGECGL